MLRTENRDQKGLRAFTLVELLVVIVILSLLIAMVTPHIQAARDEALRSDCKFRLKGLYEAAAAYGSQNRNRVPLVHEGDFATTGKILKTGGKFAHEYMQQSWDAKGAYADMEKNDNVFQCPAALNNWDLYPKREGTNYRLSGFGLDLGGSHSPGERPSKLPALYPNMMVIGGTVQARASTQVPGSKTHPPGRVCMATDWIWSADGYGLPPNFAADRGMSLWNHRKGANVLYGTGDVQWVSVGSMKQPTGSRMVPAGTYGFLEWGYESTNVYAPCGEKVTPNNKGIKVQYPDKYPGFNLPNGWGDKWPGVGVFW